jgi:hypothetical protein
MRNEQTASTFYSELRLSPIDLSTPTRAGAADAPGRIEDHADGADKSRRSGPLMFDEPV